MEEIRRLQDHLLLIRRILGWTAEEFGDKIGVTRQTINNLEAKRTDLTKTQYIAMRSVIDAEINDWSKEEQEMIRSVLEIFVDHPEKYDANKKEELMSKAKLISPAILAGSATRKEVSNEWIDVLYTLGFTMASMGIALLISDNKAINTTVNKWMQRVIKKK